MNEDTWNTLVELISNPIFLSSFFGWFTAQFIKALIDIVKGRTGGRRNLIQTLFWTTGGMPSSHSSVVVALSTSVGFTHGVNSTLFIIATVFSFVVIRDALGVRRSAGANAKTLNEIVKDLNKRFDLNYKPVKEVHGHKATEVMVGAFLGFFLGVAFCNL